MMMGDETPPNPRESTLWRMFAMPANRLRDLLIKMSTRNRMRTPMKTLRTIVKDGGKDAR
jgi:hypothetical protein